MLVFLFNSIKGIDFFQLFDELHFHWIYLFFVILLLPLNWYFELIKWKVIADRVDKVSQVKLIKSLLSGISSGLVSPNRLGNFIGRIFFFKPKSRVALTLGTLYSNFSQFLATINIGAITILILLVFNKQTDFKFLDFPLLWMFVFFGVILLFNILYFKVYLIPKLFPILNRKRNLFQLFITKFKGVEFNLFFLSAFRFLVFTIQFCLVFAFLGVKIDSTILIGTVLIFFFTTIIPSLIFGKLGIRESVAVWIFTPFIENTLVILSASFLIWFINLAIPSLIGLYFLIISRNEVD